MCKFSDIDGRIVVSEDGLNKEDPSEKERVLGRNMLDAHGYRHFLVALLFCTRSALTAHIHLC